MLWQIPRFLAGLLLLWIGLSLPGLAQVNTASLTGLVTDPSADHSLSTVTAPASV